MRKAKYQGKTAFLKVKWRISDKASKHNLRLVQQQLGHASIKTTEIYANLMATDVKEGIENIYK